MPLIEDVKARLCYNSRGEETIEVDVYAGGEVGRASAPSGASVGKYEVASFPKGGARACVELVRSYSNRLIGMNAEDILSLTQLLKEIDGTDRYERIGGAAVYSITLAAAEAAARAENKPLFRLLLPQGPYFLPYPLGNVIGGGKHAGAGAPDIQEFLTCPIGAKNIQDAIAANFFVHREARKRLEQKDPSFTGGKGDEGAWAPRLKNEDVLEVLSDVIATVSQSLGFEIRLGIDFAASSFWDEKLRVYVYKGAGMKLSQEQQVEYVTRLVEKYKPIYIEDPLHEEDFDGFKELTRRLKGVYVTGDDLFATNSQRLAKGAEMGAGNASILKLNQAGGLGDGLIFSRRAKEYGFAIITSHRSGDTPDAHISHVAVATNSKMLKSGIVGGERVAKLNELLRIDEELKGCKMAPIAV